MYANPPLPRHRLRNVPNIIELSAVAHAMSMGEYQTRLLKSRVKRYVIFKQNI